MKLSPKWATGALSLGFVCGSAYAVDPMFDLKVDKPNVFNYDYIDVGYVNINGDYDGIRVAGSFDVTQNIAVIASFVDSSHSTGSGDVDYNRFSIGAAYHFQFADVESTDVVAHVALDDGEYGFNFRGAKATSDDTGIDLGVKARILVRPEIEAFGGVSYSTLYDGDVSLTAGGVYSINRQFGVFASYELTDLDVLSVGARFNF